MLKHWWVIALIYNAKTVMLLYILLNILKVIKGNENVLPTLSSMLPS